LCVISCATVLILFWLTFMDKDVVCYGHIIQAITVVGNRYYE